MTAFAFILGVLPLVRATGAGAVSRRIMGSAVMGGMLAATTIAIFIIPVSFYVVEKLRGGDRPGAGIEAAGADAALAEDAKAVENTSP